MDIDAEIRKGDTSEFSRLLTELGKKTLAGFLSGVINGETGVLRATTWEVGDTGTVITTTPPNTFSFIVRHGAPVALELEEVGSLLSGPASSTELG